MPITLDEPQGPRIPVMKRQRIGDSVTGAVVRTVQRDVLKDGQPALKDNGKPRQELVVTIVTLPGTTMPAGIGQDIPAAVPTAGDVTRMILRGASFGQWIEAKNAMGPLQVGDIVTQTLDHAQVYNAQGAPQGGKLTTQADVDAIPRGQSVGVYGPLTLRRATAAEAQWVQMAEAEYLAQTATPLEPATAPAGPIEGF
jgi:hypothetical protein